MACTGCSDRLGPVTGAASETRLQPPSLPVAALPSHPSGQEVGRIDDLLDEGWRGLRFPRDLEARFLNDTAAERIRRLLLNSVFVAAAFNLFLVSDYLMVPDQFDLALRLRLLVFTPLLFAVIIVLARLNLPRVREGMAAVSGMAAALISAGLCVLSTDVLAPAYLVSLTSILTFASGVARMRFRPALGLDVCVVLFCLVSAWLMRERAPAALLIPVVMTVVATAVFTLYASYTMEKDERRNWLMRLREHLLLDELASANEDLDRVSRSDMLTGVANRRHVDEFLAQVWERARMDGTEVSVMMIDVDHFKAYNDRYGHPEGDACLRDVATTLKRRLRRPTDLVGRFGGEEFIAVLTDTPLSTAQAAAERVRKGVEGLNRLHSASSTHAIVTVSVGVACMRPSAPHATPAQLISAADEALYQAKHLGRNRVFAFGTAD